MLIEGSGGTGKTTLMKHLARDWACNCRYFVQDFTAVLVFECRKLARIGLEKYLEEMIQVKGEEGAEVYNWIIENSDKCLVILDGLDEMGNEGVGIEDIHQILQSTKLPHCKIIATSRISEATRYEEYFDRRIENRGFSDEGKDRYIDKYFEGNPSQCQSVHAFINAHRYHTVVVTMASLSTEYYVF